jgi:hypothetical protein
MKKARIILIAMMALALVGGALAFKVTTSFNGFLKCTYLPNVPQNITSYRGTCPLVTYSTQDAGDNRFFCTDLTDENADWCYRSSIYFEP